MSAAQSGARSPRLTAVHSYPLRTGVRRRGQGAAGIRADTAPGFASAGGGDTAASFIGAAVLVATSQADLPLPESFCGFPCQLSLNYFFFFEAFLAFLFFAITGLHQRLKEAKHEARPYCDGLFDCRNEPQRTESFRLSTSGASGLEEKFVFNMSQSAKNILGGLHIIRKAARAILIADRRASDHFLFARVGKIARNDRVVPLTARRKLGKGPGSERFVWIGRSAS